MKDLTKTNGTYVNCLIANKEYLDGLYADKNTLWPAYQKAVLDIASAAKATEAQRRFVSDIKKLTNKDAICFRLWNAVACGAGFGVNGTSSSYQ